MFPYFKILLVAAILCLALNACSSSRKQTTPTDTKTEETDPRFSSPEVRKIWVPDKIQNNRYEKGHFVFILEKGSVWTMD